MSRLKRQRLNIDGHAQVTATDDERSDRKPPVEGGMPVNHKIERQQGRSLFVRSLPATVTTETLTNLFSQSFPIKHATVVVDPVSKKSRGYGFVTFADVEDAQSAKENFDKSLFEGQRIKVEIAEPRHRQVLEDGSISTSPPTTKPTRSKPEFQPPPKLIVRNLPWTIKEPNQLATLFRSYGKVKHATLPKKKPGLSPGYGFVVLRGRKNAEKALEGVNGKEIEGRTLAVDWAVDKDIWQTSQSGTHDLEDLNQAASAPTDAQENRGIPSEESGLSLSEEDNQSDANLPDREVDPEDEESQRMSEGEPERERVVSTKFIDSHSSTLFIRNLPFSSTDESLRVQFISFGPVKYARVVLDQATERPKGTGFVCFYNEEDASSCLKHVPRALPSNGSLKSGAKGTNPSSKKQSLLEDTSIDHSGRYTMDGRVLHVTRAVDRNEATRLTFAGSNLREARDKDKRRLYLLAEGTVPSGTPLYEQLSPSEIKMREDSAKQRQTLIRSNPTLHLSLTRLSVRNLPRGVTSKDLKAFARDAVVGFAKDVKAGSRNKLSKEEESRGGEEMKDAEKTRKCKGKGIVKQAKVVFESREGNKVAEDSGAGRSRGYGFIEYSSHRWALMGLRWLNGHSVNPPASQDGVSQVKERKKRLIVEFAIENAQVVGRRLEKEAKARERSKLVTEQREKGGAPAASKKALNNDQIMAKLRKGTKRKRNSSSDPSSQAVTPGAEPIANDAEKASKRQKIIGRKRMMRKSRNQAR